MDLFISCALAALVLLMWLEVRALGSRLRQEEQASQYHKLRVAELESQLFNNDTRMDVTVLLAVQLAVEWGGNRLPRVPDQEDVCGVLLNSPAGQVLLYYPQKWDVYFEFLPLRVGWVWGGAVHKHVVESWPQITQDLLNYAKFRADTLKADRILRKWRMEGFANGNA